MPSGGYHHRSMPSTEVRQNVLTAAKRVVVKLGTQLLTRTAEDQAGVGIDTACVRRIAAQVRKLRERGIDVTLVSSGAIGAGCVELGRTHRPSDLAEAQAVAAIGQRRLMSQWHQAFARQGIKVAQLLLNRSDFDDRTRFLNIRNCLAHLHELGCVPILNENDSVSVDEIRFGDNDVLAAVTCNAVRGDALILLTVVDGLLDEAGQRVDLVEHVGDSLRLAKQEKSNWGSGGMLSKLEAARLVTAAGEVAVIANGRERNVLPRLLSGEKLGTVLLPAPRKLDARSRWIGLTAQPAGAVTINPGAVEAIVRSGRSLLASGITGLTGQFDAGAVLLIRDEKGKEVARGLTNYAQADLGRIAGQRSVDFESILGRPAYDEVIHRDNMVVNRDAK